MMITEIEKALLEVEAWLQNNETWENDLDGLGPDAVGMATVARIRKNLFSAIELLKDGEVDAINIFVRCVEINAEAHMLKTGKLEGAHYAAMKQLQKMINEKQGRKEG